jgi:hypothetical protein
MTLFRERRKIERAENVRTPEIGLQDGGKSALMVFPDDS